MLRFGVAYRKGDELLRPPQHGERTTRASCILYGKRQLALEGWGTSYRWCRRHRLALLGLVRARTYFGLAKILPNFFWRQIILNIVSLSLSWQPGFPYQQEYVYFERTTPVWLINLNYDLFLIFNDTHDQIISPKSHWQALVRKCEFITFLCVFHKYVSEFPHNCIHKIVLNHKRIPQAGNYIFTFNLKFKLEDHFNCAMYFWISCRSY